VSIQAKMKIYQVLKLSQGQDDYGSKARTWVNDGSIRAAFNPAPFDGLSAQGLVLRESESVLVTLAKGRLVAGEHRVAIDGNEYDVLHVSPSTNRFVRVSVKAVAEGLHERSG